MPPKFLSTSDILHPDLSRDFRSPLLPQASHRLSAGTPHYLIPPEMLQLQISSAPLLPSPSSISAPPNRSRAHPSLTQSPPLRSSPPILPFNLGARRPTTVPGRRPSFPPPYLTARGSDANPPLPTHPPAALLRMRHCALPTSAGQFAGRPVHHRAPPPRGMLGLVGPQAQRSRPS